MRGVSPGGCLVWTALVFGAFTGTVRADLMELQNGGRIRGEVDKPPAGKSKPTSWRMRTLNGTVLEIDAEQVRELTRRRVVIEQFEVRLPQTPETVADLWALSEWCRENSLREQRMQLLDRIVELDPEHVAAHRGLGHIQQNGEWTTQAAIMESRGYVKHKGRWVLPQELDLIEQDEAQSAEEKVWYRQVKMWKGWLDDTAKPDRANEALLQLRAIRAPAAIPALSKMLGQDAREPVRLLAMEILSSIEGDGAVPSLIQQVLKDESSQVRNAATTILKRKDRKPAIFAFTRALKNDLNVVVNRAAAALGVLGDSKAVPNLVEALITEHRYRVQVQDTANTYSFGSNGTMAQSNLPVLPPEVARLLATGQLPYGVSVQQAPLPGDNMRLRDVIVLRKEQNVEVLSALVSLTGQNFGYNRDAWKQWLKQQQLQPVKPAT